MRTMIALKRLTSPFPVPPSPFPVPLVVGVSRRRDGLGGGVHASSPRRENPESPAAPSATKGGKSGKAISPVKSNVPARQTTSYVRGRNAGRHRELLLLRWRRAGVRCDPFFATKKKEFATARTVSGRRFEIFGAKRLGRDHKARPRRRQPGVDGLES